MAHILNRPPVSIILPTYNRSWHLASTIESAICQTYDNFELIVVDDGSTDDTGDVVHSFNDRRIVYFRQTENVGMVRNWGTGLRLARGDYIIFLADDDQLLPQFIDNRLVTMLEEPDLIVVFSRYEVHDLKGNIIRTHNELLGNVPIMLRGPHLLRAALSRQWFIGASMYKRQPVLDTWPRISDHDLVLDFGLNILLSCNESGAGAYIPTNDFVLTAHPEQNSNRKLDQVLMQTSIVLKKALLEPLSAQCASQVRKELASWHVVWGRKLRSQDLSREARSHFLKAIQTDPSALWPWKELYLSLLPTRFVARSPDKSMT
jgi:glycosyltransferase involved in cell wall biosynthesis